MNLALARNLMVAAALPYAAAALQPAHAAPAPQYTLRVLETPSPQWESSVAAINDRQQIVGTVRSFELGTTNQAALWDARGLHGVGSFRGGPTSASDINNSGIIVGTSWSGGPRAYIRYPGRELTNLGTAGGWSSGASAVNSHGHVAGSADVPGGGTQAFIHDGQEMRSLGTLGGEMSYATDINDSGVVVGVSDIDPSAVEYVAHGFMYVDGSMIDLGTLGASWSEAASINNHGEIVGISELAPNEAGRGHRRAFLYTDGAMRDLGTLGGDISVATAINDRGEIVGMAQRDDGSFAAYLYSDGVMTDVSARIADPVWQVDYLIDINNNGYIIGQALHSATGAQASILLSPVPEPQALALMTAGLAVMGLYARRRGRPTPKTPEPRAPH